MLLVSMLFFILLIPLLSNGCRGSEDGNYNDINPFLDFMVKPGFDNCLICHTGGLHPLDAHCSIIDPESNRLIEDSLYSPTLEDCSKCHINTHNINGKLPSISVRCHICHQG
jgi:hypothetical protein